MKQIINEAANRHDLPRRLDRLVQQLNTQILPPLETNANLTFGGDVSGSTYFNGQGNVTANLTLDTVNSAVGNFTNAQVNVNAKGQVTWAGNGTSALTLAEFAYSVGNNTASDNASFSASVWTRRQLNTTISNNISGASLAGNVVTLPAGTYLLDTSQAFYTAVGSVAVSTRIRDTTGNVSYGVTPFTGSVSAFEGDITSATSVTINANHNFQLEAFPNAGISGGTPVGSGENEVYVRLRVLKVA